MPLTMNMRALVFIPLLSCAFAAAQFPLPYWEAFDSVRVVLDRIPTNNTWPDTLWANGSTPVPIIDFDTVVVDQCCIDPDPPILLARIERWPKNASSELLPLFTERFDADTAAWFLMGEWRNEPDTMIPLTAHPNSRVRYVWNAEGLESQADYYGTWRPTYQHHLRRADCSIEARDSLKLMRCAPHSAYRTIEPAMLLFFVNDRLVEVFQDSRGTGIDSWGYFVRSERGSIITARHGADEAIILSSGEVLVRTPERWILKYREPSIYRGECDCE